MRSDIEAARQDRSIRRRAFVRNAARIAIAIPLAARAQKPPRAVRIGFLGAESMRQAETDLEMLRGGLRELGYGGSGMRFEVRAANGDYARLLPLARELAGSGVDVLVTGGSKAGMAAKEATAVVPIVVSNMGDAVQAGFSDNLAQHGGNVTGISMMNPEVTVKQLELLREIKRGSPAWPC